MKIAILIPTLNEGENIERLLQAVVLETNKISNHSFSIVVIDGNSTDDTVAKVARVGGVLSITEEKRGLGRAYLKGITYALDTLKADAFMEFDGDYQHDPQAIPRLVEKLDEGYDYIIGSRYVKGGTLPSEWPWFRVVMSRVGNWIVQTTLRIHIRDTTSGFKLTRAAFYTQHIERKVYHRTELLYRMLEAGAKTIEVPIHFLHRHKGISKLSTKDIVEPLKIILFILLGKQ